MTCKRRPGPIQSEPARIDDLERFPFRLIRVMISSPPQSPPAAQADNSDLDVVVWHLRTTDFAKLDMALEAALEIADDLQAPMTSRLAGGRHGSHVEAAGARLVAVGAQDLLMERPIVD